jgi:hypothetical protein
MFVLFVGEISLIRSVIGLIAISYQLISVSRPVFPFARCPPLGQS